MEKYFANLVPNLATVVSPMIAMGISPKQTVDENAKIVFIGPCVAKKSEYHDPEVSDAVDAVLTYSELKEILEELNIDLEKLDEERFHLPYANFR
ncbi:MAG: [Fe-Fe] hydrogenase large subunit C-terminal domain-containing protein [Melioribacteraceae bacterium]|nr:[Fe-Fe] hydrogenase large subunit C-terminal domain-containing protein [Melioribacteraceae bacterium]